MVSRSCLCNNICAGLKFMSGGGIFLYCKIACAAVLWFMLPSEDKLICFAAFTLSSALLFDCGYATDDSLCFTPHSLRNSWKSFGMNLLRIVMLTMTHAHFDSELHGSSHVTFY